MDYELPSYFRLAKLAKEHSNHRYQIGSVIVKRRPISIGFNYQKSHPIYSDGKTYFSVHAEISAVIKAKRDISGSTIYIYRENSDGSPALARPCDECLKLLIEFNVKKIIFTIPESPYYSILEI